MIANDIINRVRDQLYDVEVTVNSGRFSEVTLCGMIGDALRKLASLRPEAFVTVAQFTLTAHSPRQRLDGATANQIIEVIANPDVAGTGYGNAIRYVDRDVLESMISIWPNSSSLSGSAPSRYQVYTLDEHDPLTFWLFPTPAAADKVWIKYVKIPTAPTAGIDTVAAPLCYLPNLVDYVTHAALLSEVRGTDQKEGQRYLNLFTSLLGAERKTQKSAGEEIKRISEKQA